MNKKFLCFCAKDCTMRVNAAIAAAMPAVEYATVVFPTLREYLPANIYAWGFILLAAVNVLLRLRGRPQ